MSSAAKVEVHVLATVMAHCLKYPRNTFQQTMGGLATKLVLLVAVVRANAMAIHIPAHISTQDEQIINENPLSLVEQGVSLTTLAMPTCTHHSRGGISGFRLLNLHKLVLY